MSFFTVKFTTRKLVTKYDHRGKVISETETEVPVTFTGLPHPTALAYSNCDNFQMFEEERLQDDRSGRSQYAHKGKQSYPPAAAPRGKTKPAGSSLSNAAASGDMSAAINGTS